MTHIPVPQAIEGGRPISVVKDPTTIDLLIGMWDTLKKIERHLAAMTDENFIEGDV